MNKAIYTIAALLLMGATSLKAQSTIELQPDGDKLRLSAVVNGVAVRAFYTEEAWNVSLSPTTFLFLAENGYLSYSDVKGNATLRIGGKDVPAMTLVIKTLRIGDMIFRDQPAALIRTQSAPMLIGPSAFSEFGSVELDGETLRVGYDNAPEIADAAKSPVDSLKTLAQTLLEDEKYGESADVFAELDKDGYLNMFTSCQYCLTLALAERYEDNISRSKQWLDKYSGLSAVSDYWIYDSMGNSAYELERYEEADGYYAKAFKTQCNLYNTSEESIANGEFHDEALGKTLFMRSKAQGRLKNLRKSEHWCLLAAKLGYAPAIEFCEKYGITR